jgi:steroid delta-isomerase-like uncharacterized protein
MKKILFTAATAMLCFFISCKDTGTSGTGTASSDNDKNLENNRKVMKAIETGDAAVIDSLIASDAVDHSGPNGMDIKGTDSVRHMLIDMHNHVKDMKMDITSAAANGNYIFTLSRFSGTMLDANMGMPAGMKMDMTGVDVVKVKDGKMTDHWSFVDQNEMMKMMKMMPPMDHKMDNKMMEHKMDSTKKM